MAESALRPDDGGCATCRDPLAVTRQQPVFQRVSAEVLLYRCPDCGNWILDDIVGFKGHGSVLRGTRAEVEAYLRNPDGRPWPILAPPPP